jgi:hypothetical protein
MQEGCPKERKSLRMFGEGKNDDVHYAGKSCEE